ncbi:MAG: hypothetical protein KBD63_08080, partial [Bacteriovoracaceae bacterium]|nr:hypothetical protein [Bacteriovoracaceae bacterium]
MMLPSELILAEDGSIYHLGLKPGELAEKIILVGDPNRVEKFEKYFDTIEMRREKREIKSITGKYKGQRLSVVSTGMGPDNIDIVMTEIDSLFNVDFLKRTTKEKKTQLTFLRLGTCGGFSDIAVGDFVFSSAAIGTDGLLHFYNCPFSSEDLALTKVVTLFFKEHFTLPIVPYATFASPDFMSLIKTDFPHIKTGMTLT